MSRRQSRARAAVLVGALHLTALVANFNDLLAGHEPSLLGVIATVMYFGSWVTFAAVAGRRASGRSAKTLFIGWMVLLAALWALFALHDAEMVPLLLVGALFPAVVLLITPFYGVYGALLGVDSGAGFVGCAAVLGWICWFAATLAARGRKRRDR